MCDAVFLPLQYEWPVSSGVLGGDDAAGIDSSMACMWRPCEG